MTLQESVYRDLLALQVMGETEVAVPFGRIDVVSPLWMFEVEPFKTWRHGVRQVLAYAQQDRWTRPALAVYGDVTRADAERMWREVRPFTELFVMNGTGFRMIRDDVPLPRCRVLRPAPDDEVLAAIERQRIRNKRRDPWWMVEQKSRQFEALIRREDRQFVVFDERELRRVKPGTRLGLTA